MKTSIIMDTQLQNEIQDYSSKAESFVIPDEEASRKANEFLRGIVSLKKKISDFCNPIIQKWHEGHKEALNQKKNLLSPLGSAENIIRKKLGLFLAEKERERQEAIREAETERERLEAEKRKKEQEAIKKAEEESNRGNESEAEKIIEETILETEKMKPQEIIPTKTKLDGTFLRTDWFWECNDIAKVPLHLLKVDESKVTAIVKKEKDQTNIPGIRVFSKKSVVTRASMKND